MVFVKLGLLSYETMSKTRSYAIVAIFVAAAMLTPTPDIFTLLLMALPMIILYEICIWLAYFDRKKNRIKEEQEARESMERQLAREEQMRAEDPTAHDHAGRPRLASKPPGYRPPRPRSGRRRLARRVSPTGSPRQRRNPEIPEIDEVPKIDEIPEIDEVPELDETPPEKKPDDGDQPGKDV